MTLKCRLRVTQVTGNGTSGYNIHNLLLVELFAVLIIMVTLKCGLEVTQGH